MPSSNHLKFLSDSPWALWRDVCVRGAGFPAQDVLKLAVPACAAAADALTDAEKTAWNVRQEVGAVLAAQTDHLLGQIYQTDKSSPANRQYRSELHQLNKAKKRLYRGDALIESVLAYLPPELAARSQAAENSRLACLAEFQQTFAAGAVEASRVLREISQSPRYHEAITWQNRQAVHTAVTPLSRTPPENKQNKRTRQREELLASYMQRYCVKNDSIGFFGPVGWGKINDKLEALTVTPGDDLLAARTVYFEDWCIKALAESLAQKSNPSWFVPRPLPHLRLDSSVLQLPMGGKVQLSGKETAVFAACDGQKTTHEIVLELVTEPNNNIQSKDEVYALLQKLHDEHRLVWSFAVSTEHAFPEQNLRQLLARIDDVAIRNNALQALDELEMARDAVAAAAGNAEKLDSALNELDTAFTRLTGNDATRRSGQVYAGRTLVYEDCRRAITLEIGDGLLHDLEGPFKLLLTSIRWYAFNAVKLYQTALRKAFREALAQFPEKAGTAVVDFSTYWLWVQPLFFGDGPLPTDSLNALFQKKWDSVLVLPESGRHVSYASADLQSRVQALFPAPRSNWQIALHHTPDVMLAAASVEAIQCGDYTAVLGEFHIGTNGLAGSCFFNQHPSPDKLAQNFYADWPKPRIIPLTSGGKMEQTSRTQFVVTAPHDVQLVLSHDQVPQPGLDWLLTRDLVVEEIGNNLIVRSRNGRYQFDSVDVFAHYISLIILNHFKITGPRDYTPRISIDKLVVQRESWRFSADALPFAFETEVTKQFLEVRQWMRQQGMPRFVFVKTPVEPKPVYVDFASPIYVHMLAKLIRQTVQSELDNPQIVISEMYPAHDELWMMDGSGQRYTSELRLVVLDTSA
ncbi:MAG: lantibiotic dehydratase [Ardenticatenaceae bacterium]|nr:lantibiotic dehydratase [Ardenticatenaceae bacterium]MCB9446043.1 lantibiotic dehydratase [Ardenticatenaceae bacterium]